MFPCGIRGVSVGTNFAYPGHSKAGNFNNYACYGGRAFDPRCYRARGDMARRLRTNIHFFSHGCPRVGCLTCFRTCAGACSRLSSLASGCRRTLTYPNIIKLVIKAQPSYVPSTLLSCFSTLSRGGFIVVRCNLRDALSHALAHVGQKRARTRSRRTVHHATTQGVCAKTRLVLNLPKRDERSVLRRTSVLSTLPLAALGLRRLRLVQNAHVTERRTRRPRRFRLCATSRCVSLIVSFVRQLGPSVIMREFMSRSPGRLLVTPS